MRLTRYIPRRLFRAVQYLTVGAFIILIIRKNSNRSDSGGEKGETIVHYEDGGHPGVFVAPQAAPFGGKIVRSRDLESETSGHKDYLVRHKEVKVLPDHYDDPDPSNRFQGQTSNKDWHDYAAVEMDKKRKGEGEQGMPVVLPKDAETAKLEDKLYRANGFDGLVSDHISVSRALKDIRHPKCKQKKYIPNLPNFGVIFPFHDEHNTTLLRGVYSVINRSPPELLKEIILVDDASTKDFLGKPLDDYLKMVGIDDIVKVLRLPKREGLIRAREKGAEVATADVIIFLDSHSEVMYNWLPPLLEPIALNWKTVVCPVVDVIDCDTFEYRASGESRGSFDWELSYKQLPLRPEDLKDPVKPYPNPVMAGGYFAINRKWFWELGGYDEGLDIWGGEQYEISFKVWQCHGSMYEAPCARVGHIYRCKYQPFPNPGIGDFISRNYKHVAEVWMDEYKQYLYKRKPEIGKVEIGDLSKQLAVREKLQCKSFDWYMKNVAFDQEKWFPAVEPPDAANGEIRSVADPAKCIDTQFKGRDELFGLRKCISDDPSGGGEQRLRFSFWKDIRPLKGNKVCFDTSSSGPKAPVVLYPCHGMQGNQAWHYKEKQQQIVHSNQHCLDCDPERGEIFMNPCDESKKSQKWKWEHFDSKVYNSWTYEK